VLAVERFQPGPRTPSLFPPHSGGRGWPGDRRKLIATTYPELPIASLPMTQDQLQQARRRQTAPCRSCMAGARRRRPARSRRRTGVPAVPFCFTTSLYPHPRQQLRCRTEMPGSPGPYDLRHGCCSPEVDSAGTTFLGFQAPWPSIARPRWPLIAASIHPLAPTATAPGYSPMRNKTRWFPWAAMIEFSIAQRHAAPALLQLTTRDSACFRCCDVPKNNSRTKDALNKQAGLRSPPQSPRAGITGRDDGLLRHQPSAVQRRRYRTLSISSQSSEPWLKSQRARLHRSDPRQPREGNRMILPRYA